MYQILFFFCPHKKCYVFVPTKFSSVKFNPSCFFFVFCGGRGLNPEPCIYYALSLLIELSSRGQSKLFFKIN